MRTVPDMKRVMLTSSSFDTSMQYPSLRVMRKFPATSPFAAAVYALRLALACTEQKQLRTTFSCARETPNVQAISSTYRSTTDCFTNRSGCR
jgi:hypothetical protein